MGALSIEEIRIMERFVDAGNAATPGTRLRVRVARRPGGGRGVDGWWPIMTEHGR